MIKSVLLTVSLFTLAAAGCEKKPPEPKVVLPSIFSH